MPEMVRSALPTAISHQAILFTPDNAYLVDAKEGDIQALALPPDAQGRVLPEAAQFSLSGGGQRWSLLGSPQGDQAYLIDLETAQVQDLLGTLASKSENVNFSFYGLFSPDETHLILGTDRDLWLLPTENPRRARRLGTARTQYGANFSPDGERIVYLQRTEAGETQVMVAHVDGSGSEVVAAGDGFSHAHFVLGGEGLVLFFEDKVTRLSLDDRQEGELLTFSGPLQRLWIPTDGEKALFSYESGETAVWQLIDLKEETARSLDDLEGYLALFKDRGHRWLFFADSVERAGARRFAGLDLETGDVHELLTLDADTKFWSLTGFAPDGEFALITALTDDDVSQLWLLRASGGAPRLLAESANSFGAFSPDGHWIAVSTMTRSDEQNQFELALMETDGDETRSLGEGLRPVWVRP
jgi:hypothetical protein